MALVIQQEGSLCNELYDQLEKAMAEATSLRREAFEESQRRDKAEKDLIEAHRRIYNEELKQRKEIEAGLLREKQELEEGQNQRDEVIQELCAELYKLQVPHISDSEHFSESDISDSEELQVTHISDSEELQVAHISDSDDSSESEISYSEELQVTHISDSEELQVTHISDSEELQVTHISDSEDSLESNHISDSEDAVEQMENYKKERDELQIELDRALKLTEELIQNQTDSKCEAPEYFICPILQEVMKDPHVAADGFSYEAEAFREWLDTGHDTSPMTNLQLAHTNLAPNLTLRSGIQEWLQRQ